MNRTATLLMKLAAVLTLAGCAVGNQYGYQYASISLPLKGSGELGLAVIDTRPYVVSGEKSADFVGIQRGGFGNPFDVNTASGDPLATDFANSLEIGLMKSGFRVKEIQLPTADPSAIPGTLQDHGAEKNVILNIREWKTDAMAKLRLIYNLNLDVFDQQGNRLASASNSGDEVISGAGFESANSTNAISAFEAKVARLFNTPEISAVLND